jgi:hypothetical protein
MVFVGEVTTLTTVQFAWILFQSMWWLLVLAILLVNSNRLEVYGKVLVRRTIKTVREDIQKVRGTYSPEVHLRKSHRSA